MTFTCRLTKEVLTDKCFTFNTANKKGGKIVVHGPWLNFLHFLIGLYLRDLPEQRFSEELKSAKVGMPNKSVPVLDFDLLNPLILKWNEKKANNYDRVELEKKMLELYPVLGHQNTEVENLPDLFPDRIAKQTKKEEKQGPPIYSYLLPVDTEKPIKFFYSKTGVCELKGNWAVTQVIALGAANKKYFVQYCTSGAGKSNQTFTTLFSDNGEKKSDFQVPAGIVGPVVIYGTQPLPHHKISEELEEQMKSGSRFDCQLPLLELLNTPSKSEKGQRKRTHSQEEIIRNYVRADVKEVLKKDNKHALKKRILSTK